MEISILPLLAALAIVMSAVVPSNSAFAQDHPKSDQFWWPERLDLSPLRDQDPSSNPYGEDFDYAEAFQPGPRGRQAGPREGHDDVPGLVAG